MGRRNGAASLAEHAGERSWKTAGRATLKDAGVDPAVVEVLVDVSWRQGFSAVVGEASRRPARERCWKLSTTSLWRNAVIATRDFAASASRSAVVVAEKPR